MEQTIVNERVLQGFRQHLQDDEKSRATLDKYMRDVKRFAVFAAGQELDKGLLLAYKAHLEEHYAIRSANSMLAAVNALLCFMGLCRLRVRQFRVQKEVYCSAEKELTREEYNALIRAAEARSNYRLSLVLQTLCGTGIRVSELVYVTAEAVNRGEAVVSCKGKTRKVFLVTALRKKLQQYARREGITTGPLFLTRGGRPLDRSNIWREMKALCRRAGVSPEKVFPHNLRHLFARVFYGIEKDIAKLADILGHTNINTTRVYIISTGAEHRRKLESMRLIL